MKTHLDIAGTWPTVTDISVRRILWEDIPQKDRGNAVALYNFYYHHACIQKTNKAFVQNSFVSGIVQGYKTDKGLGWSREKIGRIRQLLIKHGLIQVCQTRRKDGTFRQTYIRVIWYKGRDAVEKAMLQRTVLEQATEIEALKSQIQQLTKLLAGVRKNRLTVKSTVNAYRLKKEINACSPRGTVGTTKSGARQHTSKSSFVMKKSKPTPSFGMKCAKKLHTILVSNRKLMRREPVLSTWAKEFTRLLADNDITKKELLQTLRWYAQNIKQTYTPKAYSAKTFCDKYVRMRDQMQMQVEQRQRQQEKDRQESIARGEPEIPKVHIEKVWNKKTRSWDIEHVITYNEPDFSR